MAEQKKDFPKVEDLLPEGRHVLKVKPHPEFKDKQPVEGSHKHGSTSFGNWYMYDTKINDTWVSIFANDENKEYFDSGTVVANIVPKRLKGMDNDLFDENGKKLLKAFYNEFREEESEKTVNVDDIEF